MTSDSEKTPGRENTGPENTGAGSLGPETATAAQGSQPTIAGLRIGIVDAATRGDVSKARLVLRPASGDRAVTVTVGETVEIPGFAVTLDAVENAPRLPEPGEEDARTGTADAASARSGEAGRSARDRAHVRITVAPTA